MYSLGGKTSKLVSLSKRPSMVEENKCHSSTAEMSPKLTLQNLHRTKEMGRAHFIDPFEKGKPPKAHTVNSL